jgi:OOP family OmpA-OmpF porin
MAATKTLILVVIIAALPCMASAATSVNDGYLVDSAESVVKNGYGGCWHTGYWTPAMAVVECDALVHDEIKPSPKLTTMPSPPQPAPAQEKMPSLKINISEAAHFDFDKSVLKPEDKAILDSLVRELDGAAYESIYVTGHTDRIGRAEYNMGLSLRRANEVKSYLIKKGIPANRIEVEGRGKLQPVTKPTDCRGITSARSISCLQPDRRTEVTVTVTKGSIASQR